jgi:putative membrane protein
MFTGVAAIAMVVLMGWSPASAEAKVSEQDRQFLRQAHQGNLGEIAAGKVAQAKGAAEDVHSIGATLVTDHTRLDTAVKQTARSLRVSLPSKPTSQDQAMLKRVAAMSGSAFDRAWVAAMIEGHRMALELGKQELRAGTSPEVKALAESSAPVIQRHLSLLLAAQKTVGKPHALAAGDGVLARSQAAKRWQGLGSWTLPLP